MNCPLAFSSSQLPSSELRKQRLLRVLVKVAIYAAVFQNVVHLFVLDKPKKSN